MQLHARLREAERWSALGAFGRHLAHELKNPLNALVLRVSLLERRCRGMPEGCSDIALHARVIRDEAARLGRLIDDGLGALSVRGAPSAVDLRAAVAGALTELEETVRDSRTELTRDLGADPALVRAEPDRLGRVVRQMVEDALARASTEHSRRVRVSVRRNGDDWRLDIERTGPHFPDVAELFTPGAARSLAGTGMELALSRRIVRALGGELTAENLKPGGARMTLALPVARS
jgi:two-component system sensor histidine kinase HydH